MKQVQVNGKLIYDPVSLQAVLVNASFAVTGVTAQMGATPFVIVYMDDSETKDPRPIVLSYTDPPILTAVAGPVVPPDGVSKVSVMIQKKDRAGQPVPGNEQLQVIPSQMIGISPMPVVLSNGAATMQVGPSTLPGSVMIQIQDVGKIMSPAMVSVSFG
jgi:hypothetical protein